MALTDQQSYIYWLERDGIAIAKLNSDAAIDSRFSGPPVGKTITIFSVKSADDLSTDLTDDPTTDSGVPEEFCEAFVEKAIQKGYEVKMGQDPNMAGPAQYWEAKFEKSVREGKKYATKNRSSITGGIKGWDY
jgi:hypothetical protein